MKCPAGTYGSTTGLSSSSCSGSCGAGQFSLAGSSACTACPLGRYGTTGATTAMCSGLCPVSTYGGATGLTTITCSGICTVGAGTYCPIGATSSLPLPCPPGTSSVCNIKHKHTLTSTRVLTFYYALAHTLPLPRSIQRWRRVVTVRSMSSRCKLQRRCYLPHDPVRGRTVQRRRRGVCTVSRRRVRQRHRCVN